MRIERIIYTVLIISSSAVAALNWRKAALFEADNEALRAKVDSLEAEISQSTQVAELVKNSSDKLRTQSTELNKLRGEVTQLRATAKAAETLTSENQRLRAQNEQLQARLGTAALPVQDARERFAGHDQFPRNSWNFAGYSSPEAALVSAIWAMREGDPKTYLASLAPEEQQRVSQNWQNKTEAELAEKHKNDVSAISGLRVLERQNVAPNEMVMNVYLEGPGRVEKVRMNQVGQDWKFGGFIRDQQQAAAPLPPAK
jgi:hypothetical protein